MKIVWILIMAIVLSSCSTENTIEKDIIQRFSDTFYTLNPYWDTTETRDVSRYGIVQDPTNPENNALIVHLLPDDFFQGKKRNELKIKTKDTIGYEVNYSLKFMLPPDFFTGEKELDWIMIHQWHDEPPRGLGWGDYNMQTNPPIQLYVHVLPGDNYYIVYAYGLWNKDKKEIRHLTYEYPLEPNEWYTFENTIRWSMDESGFSIPKINGEVLIKQDENDNGKIFGANMFNDVPNYFKMGLYGNYVANDSISVYLDDFKYWLYLP